MMHFLSSPRRKLIVAFALVAAVLTVIGCSTDGTAPAIVPQRLAGPPVIDPSIGSAPVGARSLSASVALYIDDTLQAVEAREDKRVADEAIRSKSIYDSLFAIWNATHSKQGGNNRPVATTIATCEPQPYAAQVQIVGPEGALFNVGAHKFYIPRGALTKPTVITVEAPVSTHAELSFSPHGLHFGTAFLMLDYHNCDIGHSKWRDVLYTDDQYNILDAPPSFDQRAVSSVWAAINHFSKYVVAW